jgi:hypothetical protein
VPVPGIASALANSRASTSRSAEAAAIWLQISAAIPDTIGVAIDVPLR